MLIVEEFNWMCELISPAHSHAVTFELMEGLCA